MFKKESGITLVALVVTIIVLLILAGVAISLTIGQNGIFTRAQNATQRWDKASTNEAEQMNDFTDTYDDVVANLNLDD